MKNAIETFARLGIMGFLGTLIVCTLTGLAAYGFVVRPDHDLTAQLIGILGVGAGALLLAVGAFFKPKGDTIRLGTTSIGPLPGDDTILDEETKKAWQELERRARDLAQDLTEEGLGSPPSEGEGEPAQQV